MSSITLCERIDTSLQLALLPSFEGFEFGWGIFLAAVFYTLHKTYAASKIGSQTIVFTLLLIVYLPLVVVSKSFYFGSEIHDMMMNQKFCFLMSTVEDSVPWQNDLSSQDWIQVGEKLDKISTYFSAGCVIFWSTMYLVTTDASTFPVLDRYIWPFQWRNEQWNCVQRHRVAYFNPQLIKLSMFYNPIVMRCVLYILCKYEWTIHTTILAEIIVIIFAFVGLQPAEFCDKKGNMPRISFEIGPGGDKHTTYEASEYEQRVPHKLFCCCKVYGNKLELNNATGWDESFDRMCHNQNPQELTPQELTPMVTPENRQQDTPIQTPDNHVPLYNPYPRLDQSPSLSETLQSRNRILLDCTPEASIKGPQFGSFSDNQQFSMDTQLNEMEAPQEQEEQLDWCEPNLWGNDRDNNDDDRYTPRGFDYEDENSHSELDNVSEKQRLVYK